MVSQFTGTSYIYSRDRLENSLFKVKYCKDTGNNYCLKFKHGF